MKFILLSQRGNTSARYFDISLKTILVGFVAGAVLLGSAVGYFGGRDTGPESIAEVDAMRSDLAEHQAELTELRARAQEQIDALAIRMGSLNARAIRLNALGRRLADMAELNDGEFDFNNEPAVGGPLETVAMAESGQGFDFVTDFDAMERTLYDQEQQLTVLESLMLKRKLHDRVYPRGRPVTAGYISSYFGTRKDPFNGKAASHKGVDFAGKRGSDVIAVAGGVVTYSGPRYGYGNMVEINHGDGYVTRYAHNEENLVVPGDQVQPGQRIALMGSTGRATGPNLHFEVWHRGRPVNPLKYVSQDT